MVWRVCVRVGRYVTEQECARVEITAFFSLKWLETLTSEWRSEGDSMRENTSPGLSSTSFSSADANGQ